MRDLFDLRTLPHVFFGVPLGQNFENCLPKIVYGANIQDALHSGFHELQIPNSRLKELGASRVEIVSDFLRDEAVALFHLFDQQPNKRIY